MGIEYMGNLVRSGGGTISTMMFEAGRPGRVYAGNPRSPS